MLRPVILAKAGILTSEMGSNPIPPAKPKILNYTASALLIGKDVEHLLPKIFGTDKLKDTRMQEATPRQVVVYEDVNSREPFTDWLYSLRDLAARRARLGGA